MALKSRNRESFDYVVVGGGSAGCVIAARLSENPKTRVLLLEAGPTDASPLVRMPAGFFKLIGSKRTWVYETEPEAAANGRRMYVPQGRTLGGGSSVNGMVYIRGQREDYDDWLAGGCAGWGFADVLPYFCKAEGNMRLAGPLHGTDGPLKVIDNPQRHPLSLAFVRAAQEAGALQNQSIAYNHDFNGERQDGVGFFQVTMFEGERANTPRQYLRSGPPRPNLTVRTGVLASRIMIENKCAVGVTYCAKSKKEVEVVAKREIIVTAGAFATPKLLMLSGIGPAAHLREHGIAVVADLPGVGGNFQDHLSAPVSGRLREPISLLGHSRGLKAARHLLQWALFRTGLLTTNVVEAGGFFDLDGDGRPDIQFHVLPLLAGDIDRLPLPGHGITLNPCFLECKSRGEIRLRSPDPAAAPLFRANFLSHPGDVESLVRGVRLARRILKAPSLARLVEAELLPGEDAPDDDATLAQHVRRYAKTVYHPVGTCKMGVDRDAVVDAKLKVRGIDGLRVADASIMPTIVRGNTNAPTIMIAERAADFIARGT